MATGYIAGAGPDLIASQRAKASRLLSMTRDAVYETTQRIPAPIAYADVHSPQVIPRRGLGLADAAVGVQTGGAHLPGRLPPGVVV